MRAAQVALLTVEKFGDRLDGRMSKAALGRVVCALKGRVPGGSAGPVRSAARAVIVELEAARAGIARWALDVGHWEDIESGLARS